MTIEHPHTPDHKDAPYHKDADVIAFKEIQAKARRAARPKPDPEADRARNRSNVAALVFAVILIVVGWLLIQKLGANGRMEDCLMSGRTNCAPINTTSGDN
ncbi:MAG TPA: hypothetical protein VH722_00390 [Alphaproteobacteria bacterium]|jgi:hypothetical protein|nr:hypothetical protein [Alphaproteobacteria bacterium]